MEDGQLETYWRQSAMEIVAALPTDQEAAKRILAYAAELVRWRPPCGRTGKRINPPAPADDGHNDQSD